MPMSSPGRHSPGIVQQKLKNENGGSSQYVSGPLFHFSRGREGKSDVLRTVCSMYTSRDVGGGDRILGIPLKERGGGEGSPCMHTFVSPTASEGEEWRGV